MDESEIEWRLLPDEDWVRAYDLSLKKGRVQLLTLPLSDQHNWPGHILKKRYLKLKKDVEGSENMPVSPTHSLISFLKSARLTSMCELSTSSSLTSSRSSTPFPPLQQLSSSPEASMGASLFVCLPFPSSLRRD